MTTNQLVYNIVLRFKRFLILVMLYRSSDHIATFYSGLRTDLYLWSKNPKSPVSARLYYILKLPPPPPNLYHAFCCRKYKMINNACLSDYVAHIYSVLDIDFIYLFTYFYMSATTNICGNFFFYGSTN